MEGIGSRTGRQSSRYGSAPVFTGPVRRWQKQWVHVSSSSSSSSATSYKSNSKASSSVSTVRIRRWTPIPSGEDSEFVAVERPRRKLRYAPIVVLESKKKEAENSDFDVKEGSKTSQSAAHGTSENDDNEKKSVDNALAAKAQIATKDLNNRPMDLDTGDDYGDDDDDDDDDEDHDLGGADKGKAADWVNAAKKGFAC